MKDWMNELPDGLKASGVLDQYDSPEAALQGLIDTKAIVGQSIRIPGEDASVDDMSAFTNKLIAKVPSVMLKPDMNSEDQSANFYKTLGVPEAADKYKKPDGVDVTPEAEAGLRDAAIAMNLTQAQFASAMKNMSKTTADSASAATLAGQEATNKLKGEWGAAYDERMALAKKLHDANFAEGTGVAFENLDPAAIPGLYATAKALMGEGNQFGDHPPTEIVTMTPLEAETKISEMLGNREHPYWNPADGGHKAAQAKMMELQAAKAGRTDKEFVRPLGQRYG